MPRKSWRCGESWASGTGRDKFKVHSFTVCPRMQKKCKCSHPDESRDPRIAMIFKKLLDTGFRRYESVYWLLVFSDSLFSVSLEKLKFELKTCFFCKITGNKSIHFQDRINYLCLN